MFINNKYYSWYLKIVEVANNRNTPKPSEVHHIIPKSLGGSDCAENLCNLTPREHFICHLLLTRFTTGLDKNKMTYAFWGMTHRNDIKLNSRLYDTLKIEFYKINSKPNIEKFGHNRAKQISKKISETSTGRIFSLESRQKMSEAHKGKVVWNAGLTKENSESLKKLSKKLLGKTRSVESIEKQRMTITGNTRQPHREESKRKSSESNKNRPYLVCPHCGKSAQQGNYNRWHGSNCKKIKG